MWDILNFNTFITQYILIFVYYLGVLIIPVLIYLKRDLLKKNISFYWSILFAAVLIAELFWRMVFEVMIGYFDMHDYLHVIAEKL